MAAYVRELWSSYVHQHIDVLRSVDIEVAVKELLSKGKISKYHVTVAYMYAAGWKVAELEVEYVYARDMLIHFFRVLAAETQQTDDIIVNLAISHNPRYARFREAFQRTLEAYGETFV